VQDRTRMSRDQRRSLWIAHAVAGEVVRDPEAVVTRGRQNLARLSARGSNKWILEWQRLLDGPIDDLLVALTSTSLRSRELRQNSPFAGVLPPADREKVLESFSSRGKRQGQGTG